MRGIHVERGLLKRRKYEHRFEPESRPAIFVKTETGEVVLNPTMSIFVSTLIRGAFTDRHMTPEQTVQLLGLASISETSKHTGTTLTVKEFDQISELSLKLEEGYQSRDTFIGRKLGPASSTGAARAEFEKAKQKIPEVDLDAARERANEIVNTEPEGKSSKLLDEYTFLANSLDTPLS